MSTLPERLDAVRARIAAACALAGRAADEVTLVAVSKRHPVEAMREAYAAGQREFGENYAQELAEKAAALADLPDLRIRFIGGLQRNKIKLLVPAASAIETVASAEVGRAIAKRAAELGLRVPVLVQVNTSREAQKGGVGPDELGSLLDALRALPALSVEGLMTIPAAGDPDGTRASFAELRVLRDAHGLRTLSMGMSDDLELAIAEGATSVRVGTAIFGPRPGYG